MFLGAGASALAYTAGITPASVYGAYQAAKTAYSVYDSVMGKRKLTDGAMPAAKKRAIERYGVAAVKKYFVSGRDRANVGGYGRYTGRPGELKFFDTALSFNVDGTAEIPATGQLCLLGRGDDPGNYVGRQFTLKSIAIRGSAGMVPAASVTASSTAFFYLVLDKQANGAAAGVTDVFDGTNLATAFHNLDNASRFTILKKWKHTYNPSAGVSGAYNNNQWHFEVYKKCNILFQMDGAIGGDITHLKTSNVFLIAGTDGASDDIIQVSGQARLRFTDM
nr:MAG TPA: capsid protein [Cressdnaviricota sp.]